MSKSIIIFGSLNKKLLLPFFLALAQILFIIVSRFYPEKISNAVLQHYSLSIGEICIIFIPYIFNISQKEKQIEKEIKNKRCLHYFTLCFLYALDYGIRNINSTIEYTKTDKGFSYNESNLYMINDFITLSIEMIVVVLITIKLLKYKYFRHHIISTAFFIFFGIICEIILGNYESVDTIFIIITILRIINVGVDALYYCYQKYMMEILFYPYWNVAFIPGVFNFCIACGLLLFALVNSDKENSSILFVSTFYLYFKEMGAGIIVGKVITVLILHLILCPLAILTIYYFNPNYILIIVQLSTITEYLIKKPKETSYCIALYIFQFIALMIHLEILELNFCGLNKYTKRNIEIRGIEELTFEGRDSSVYCQMIDLNDNYYVNNLKQEEIIN